MRRRPPSPKIFDHTRSGVKTHKGKGIHQSVGETIASAARPGISAANLEHRRAQRVADLVGRGFGRIVDRPRAAQKKLIDDLRTAVDAIPAVRGVNGGTRKERAQRQREIAKGIAPTAQPPRAGGEGAAYVDKLIGSELRERLDRAGMTLTERSETVDRVTEPVRVFYDEAKPGLSREEWDALEAEAKRYTADRPTPIEDDPES